MEFNQYNQYSKNAGISSYDEVDSYVRDINQLKGYNDVMNYIKEKFGDIEGGRKLIEYNDINKQVEIVIKEDAVEFFTAKNWCQTFGKGWRKPKEC